MGLIDIEPHEIAVIPRVCVSVTCLMAKRAATFYENFGVMLKLPDLGVIGSNGLANPRDFLTPTAWYEDREGDFQLVAKFSGNLGVRRSVIHH